MQLVQDPSQSNVDDVNNVRRTASKTFHKEKEYLKVKMEENENNSNIKNTRDLYRGIEDFKKGYQHLIKDDKGVLDFKLSPCSVCCMFSFG